MCSALLKQLFTAEILLFVAGQNYQGINECVDKSGSCSAWAGNGECTRNPSYMKINCKRSCGICTARCEDSRYECSGWANRGACARNPSYMRTYCKKSCGLCRIASWGSWTSWSVCSKTCGNGLKKRTRTCSKSAAQNGGLACSGSSQQTARCNTQRCPAVCLDKNNFCSGWAKRGECRSNPAYMLANCKRSCRVCVDGNWGAWNGWSACSRSCGTGLQKRTRTCSNPVPKGGGRSCSGSNQQMRNCKVRDCPATTVAPPSTTRPLVCGRPKRSRIVGGEVASNRDWPWQVGLQSESDNFIFCGGSLISREWVVTAAHCITRNIPNRQRCARPSPGLRVILGEFDVQNIEGHEVQIAISEVCMHESYHKVTYDNDIALLRLSTPLSGFNETMSPVCLPSSSSSFPVGKVCSVTGWGKTSQDDFRVSNKLRVAHVPIIDHAKCKEQYGSKGYVVTDHMICAGYSEGKIDSCKGDSGGPFVCKQNGRYFLVGATSWGVGCAQAGNPGVYTDIKDYLPWIQNITSLVP
ncbi:PREDICTED: coagulation factor VII-like isoform X3 [Acropora digitifera]|uniref:coagulation factor VII-like isoform X3 n=1 Tax=Acropora digitifera TaxID=70779 RepID=UPI00077A9A95|nr:PREDICTED: coagulation factor VII-like isoform X3 [Acropora digitifera]